VLTADSNHQLVAFCSQLHAFQTLAELRETIPTVIQQMLSASYVALATTRADGSTRYSIASSGAADAYTGDMEYCVRLVMQSPHDMTPKAGSLSSWAMVLAVRGRILGALYVAQPDHYDGFTTAEHTLLQLIAMQLATTLESLSLKRDIDENLRATDTIATLNYPLSTRQSLLPALEDIAAALISQQPLDAVLDRILANISQVMKCDAINIMLLENDILHVARARGYEAFGVGEWIMALQQTMTDFPLTAQVIATGTPLIITDTGKHLKWRYITESAWIRSHAKAIMQIGGEIIGVVNLDSASVGTYNESDSQTLQLFADQAALAIYIARLVERERHRATVEESLRQSVQTLNETLNLSEVFTRIIENLSQVAHCDTGSVQVLDGTDLVIVACDGFDDPQAVIGQRFSIIDNQIVKELAETKLPLQVEDASIHPTFKGYLAAHPDIRFRTWLGVPFIVNGSFVGQFTLDRNEVRPFTDEEIKRTVAFANHAAIALENAQLHTQLQQRAEDRERSWSQAVESNRMRTQLITNVAHDIRSPLSTVLTSLIMLRDGLFGDLSEKQRDWLQSSISSVDMVMRLSQDFFDLTKSEMGQLAIYSDAVELSVYLQRIARLGRTLPWSDEVSFEADIPDALPTIELDKTRIQQVLMNLLYNALKFTESGTVRLYAQYEKGAEQVRIGVKDTGIGIDAAELDTIFERFKQAGSNRQRQQGTGIGLAVCKELVHLHGGQLYVTSKPGIGSDFYFTLHLQAPAAST